MEKNQRALLELIKAALFGVEPKISDDVDWDAVLKEAEEQTVTALVAPAVPTNVVGSWRAVTARTEARFLRVLHDQTQLVGLLEEAGIPLVILKGTAAAMYYPAPYHRMMGDVDLLVPQERFEEAAQLMEENGYKPFRDLKEQLNMPVKHRHIEFGRDGLEYELHHHFSMNKIQIEDLLMNGLKHAKRGWAYKISFPVLPALENGLVLLAHAYFHLNRGELGLRQVIDWMMFVYHEMDDTTWENSFGKIAEDVGLEKLATGLTRLCRDWLGLPGAHSWCEATDVKTVAALLELVFERGNFARKLDSPHKVEKTTKTIRTQGFFPYLMRTAGRVWNSDVVSGSKSMLRPLIWTKESGRLIISRLTERPDHLVEEIKRGEEIARLFKKLGIQ